MAKVRRVSPTGDELMNQQISRTAAVEQSPLLHQAVRDAGVGSAPC